MESLADRDVRNVDFSGAVLLAPVRFLMEDLVQVCRSLDGHVTRQLQEDDLVRLLLLWKNEAELPGDETLHVLLIEEPGDERLTVFGGRCVEQLQGLCLETESGKVAFTLVPTDGMIALDELYRDLIHLVLSSKKVRKLILLPLDGRFEPLNDMALVRILEDLDLEKKNEKLLSFELWPTSLSVVQKLSLVHSLAHVMGFRAE